MISIQLGVLIAVVAFVLGCVYWVTGSDTVTIWIAYAAVFVVAGLITWFLIDDMRRDDDERSLAISKKIGTTSDEVAARETQ